MNHIKNYLEIKPDHLPKKEWEAIVGNNHTAVQSLNVEFGGDTWVLVNGNIETDAPELPVLATIMKFAEKDNCRWIMFNCDAEAIDELPTFEW